MLGNKNSQNILLTIIIVCVLILAAYELISFAFPDFNAHDYMHALFLIILLVFIGGSFLRRRISMQNLFESIKAWLLWVLIFFVVIVGYAFRHELDDFKQRVISVLIPSYTIVEEGRIILARHADGHFYVNAQANDRAKIKFLIDTGASGVALTKRDAINMGFDPKKLDYTQRINTANGITFSAPVKIKKLQIGKKVVYNVSAHVTSGGLDISLLGMSVIDDFSDFRFTNDNLILHY